MGREIHEKKDGGAWAGFSTCYRRETLLTASNYTTATPWELSVTVPRGSSVVAVMK